MAHRRSHRVVVLAGLALAMLALLALARAEALAALPAALALWLPASGRYVGERRLVALVVRRRRLRRRAGSTPSPRQPHALRALPRGGRLIAARLAWRGPPAATPQ